MPIDESEQARRERLRALLAELKREQRDARLRAGKAKPRTHREMEIFGADLLKRPADERPDGRETT